MLERLSAEDMTTLQTLLLLTPEKVFEGVKEANRNNSVPDVCGNQTFYLLNHLKEQWAMKSKHKIYNIRHYMKKLCFGNIAVSCTWIFAVLDSWAKPERGLLNGNLNWIGAYDECINITNIMYLEGGADDAKEFDAQYCTLDISIPIQVSKAAKLPK